MELKVLMLIKEPTKHLYYKDMQPANKENTKTNNSVYKEEKNVVLHFVEDMKEASIFATEKSADVMQAFIKKEFNLDLQKVDYKIEEVKKGGKANV